MPHPEQEHSLRIQLATALRERDEYRTNWVSEEARRIKAEEALAAARRECEALRKALHPFALLGAEIAASIPDSKPLWSFGSAPAMTAGDIRRAAALAAPRAAAGEEK